MIRLLDRLIGLIGHCLMMLLTPIMLPFAIIAQSRQKSVRIRVAKDTACQNCKNKLGKRGVQIANKAWRKFNKVLVKEDPVKHRPGVRTLYAVCPKCQALYTFHGKRKKYKLMQMPPKTT